MHEELRTPTDRRSRARGRGTSWRTFALSLCVMGAAVSARAQAPGDEARREGDASRAGDASGDGDASRAGDASGDGDASREGDASGEGDASREGRAGAAAERTDAADDAPSSDGPAPGDPEPVRRGAALASPRVAAAVEPVSVAEPAGPRPRGWRLPRETVRRPLTLPQGVLRFDSTLTLSAVPGRFGTSYLSGFMGLAAGLFDDVEIGAVPFGTTFIPPLTFQDPFVYGRVRALSGDVQIAFRAGTTLPVAGQLPDAQMELGAELAWLVHPIFRIDTGVDYALLFSDPLYQRIGVPVTATVQLDIHAVALTTAVYVFNDFDDVDVPLLLRYTVTFRGYQGPGGEWAFEAGFTDLEHAEDAWTMRSCFTFFAFL